MYFTAPLKPHSNYYSLILTLFIINIMAIGHLYIIYSSVDALKTVGPIIGTGHQRNAWWHNAR